MLRVWTLVAAASSGRDRTPVLNTVRTDRAGTLPSQKPTVIMSVSGLRHRRLLWFCPAACLAVPGLQLQQGRWSCRRAEQQGQAVRSDRAATADGSLDSHAGFSDKSSPEVWPMNPQRQHRVLYGRADQLTGFHQAGSRKEACVFFSGALHLMLPSDRQCRGARCRYAKG